MTRLGAWWLRTEPKVTDWCERFLVPEPLPPVPPTTQQVIAEQLTRIADALAVDQASPYSLDEYEKAHAAESDNRALIETLTFRTDGGGRIEVTGRNLSFTETPPSPGSEATAPANGEAEPTPVADSVPAPQPSPSPRAAGESVPTCDDDHQIADGSVVYCDRAVGHRELHLNIRSGATWPHHPLYVSA